MWEKLDPRKKENWKLPKMHWGLWLMIGFAVLYFVTKFIIEPLVGR